MAAQRRNTGARAGDLTGKRKAELTAEKAEEIKERQKELATITEVIEEEKKTPVDYTEGGTPSPGPAPVENTDESADANAEEGPVTVESQPVQVKAATRKIQVNTDLPQVVIGAGNWYNFEVGRVYTVPAHVANHLEEKGLLWH